MRRVLVPRLEADGIKACIDYRDFRLGVPLIKEMQRAVVESRYSLAVFTAAYLESNFTDFENVIAQHLGLETSEGRFLAIVREECKLELRIRAQLWLDMTDDREFDSNVERLAAELRKPPARVGREAAPDG